MSVVVNMAEADAVTSISEDTEQALVFKSMCVGVCCEPYDKCVRPVCWLVHRSKFAETAQYHDEPQRLCTTHLSCGLKHIWKKEVVTRAINLIVGGQRAAARCYETPYTPWHRMG